MLTRVPRSAGCARKAQACLTATHSLCSGPIISKVLTDPPSQPFLCLFPSFTFAENCLKWTPTSPPVSFQHFCMAAFSSKCSWSLEITVVPRHPWGIGSRTTCRCWPSVSSGYVSANSVSTGPEFMAAQGQLDLICVFPCSQPIFSKAWE